MSTVILTPIVAALSALLGVALTAYVQLRNQRNNQQFQIAVERVKYERDRADIEKTESLRRMAEAHKTLSAIAREFSVTTLDILWRSSMTDSEYDQRYLVASSNMDDLRAFAGLHESSLIDDIEKLHGQMNIFWGSFKNVLYQTSQGQKVDHTSSSLMNAHAAANEIGRAAFFVKGRLTQLAPSVRGEG